jgi:hypothetical protein
MVRTSARATFSAAVTQATRHRARRHNLRKEAVMDAKYNRLIDHIAVRVFLNTTVFALWLVAAVGLLELAVKV